MRRPSARVPFVILLSGALAGGVVADRAGDRSEATTAAVPTAEVVDGSGASPAIAGTEAGTYYCAAGTGGEGQMADHSVVVSNTGPDPATAIVRAYPGRLESGTPSSTDADVAWVPVVVPPGGRESVRLGDVVAADLVAAVVEVVEGRALVTHEVAGPHGRSAGACATSAGDEWHFAWGATTRDARELIVLFNPFPSPASVDATFETDDGRREPVRFQGVPVPGRSVVALDVGSEVTRREVVATTVHVRRGQVVAERIQSFDGSAGPSGLALALGSPEPAATWAWAAGRVSEEGAPTVVVYNPGDERAEVDVVVVPDPSVAGAAAPEPFGLTVAPGDVKSLPLGDEQRVPTEADFALLARSTNGVPVVVERVVRTAAAPTDDTDGGGEAGAGEAADGGLTAAPGSPVGATEWWIGGASPEGGPGPGVAVLNPDPDRGVRVSVRRVTPDGSRELLVSQVVPAGGRRNLELSPAFDGSGPLVVESASPVVIEGHVPAGRATFPPPPALPGAPGVVGLTRAAGAAATANAP